MTDSVYIRLAGPLQSWAGPVVSGNFVRTNLVPTESALQGLLAGAMGCRRGHWPEWLSDVQFTVREDSRPVITDDFQTIGSREEEFEFRRRIALAQGMKATSVKQLAFKPAVRASATTIIRRTYLADAEFLVRVTAEGHTEEIDQAFSSPVFSTYLGKKAFPASFPFYLGVGNSSFLSQIPVMNSADEKSHSVVKVHELSLGSGSAPYMEKIPSVSSREIWMERILDLKLAMRKTI